MKITVQFDSLAEFQEHMIQRAGIMIEPTPVEKQPDPAPVEEEPKKLPAEPEEVPEEAETPAVTEDFRVEVRKTLAALNKLQAGNPAKALIAETGYKRLTDVPLELLPGLMQKAEEAMNHV